MDDNVTTFGDRLKQLRTEENLTLDKLKDILHTTKATLSRYENRLRQPKYEFVKECANYFNVSTDYMLGRTNDKNCNIFSDAYSLLANTLSNMHSIKYLTSDQKLIPEDRRKLIESLLKSAIELTKLK